MTSDAQKKAGPAKKVLTTRDLPRAMFPCQLCGRITYAQDLSFHEFDYWASPVENGWICRPCAHSMFGLAGDLQATFGGHNLFGHLTSSGLADMNVLVEDRHREWPDKDEGGSDD